MRAQLGRLTTAFFSSGIKWRDPLVLISMEILTDVMNGWFPAELGAAVRPPVFLKPKVRKRLFFGGGEKLQKWVSFF